MYLGSWKIDDLVTFYANTTRFDTGNATDADAVPAYRIYEDETGTAILTGNMALLDSANTAGFYSEQITLSAANGFEKGKSYAIYIAATVNSVAGATHHTLQIEAEVDANTVSPVVSANVTQLGGVAQSLTDLKDFADDGYDPATNKVQGVVLTDTLTTYTGNTPQTGDSFTRLGAPAGASVSADIVVIDNFVDDLESRLTATRAGYLDNLSAGAAALEATAQSIKAKTDQLTFTIANKVDSSIQAAGDFAQAAADKVWSTAVRILTASTNIVLAKGVGVTGFNDLSAAQVNTEVDTALADARLDELLAADSDIDGAAPPTVGSVFHELLSKTAGSFTYDQTTDSQEAIRDRGDAAWTSGGTAPTVIEIRQEMDTNSIQLAAIVADTNELQTDWVNGGRLDNILDARASQTSMDTVASYIDTEIATLVTNVATILTAAVTEIADIKTKTDQLVFTIANQLDVNALRIEGIDATDQIRDSIVNDATRFAGADIATLLAAVDTEVAAILAAVITEIADIKAKTDQLTFTNPNKVNASLQAAADVVTVVANKIADVIIRRSQANVEVSTNGDTLELGSLYGLIQQAQEANTTDNIGKLTIYQTDGVTELAQKDIATDVTAEPMTGVS